MNGEMHNNTNRLGKKLNSLTSGLLFSKSSFLGCRDFHTRQPNFCILEIISFPASILTAPPVASANTSLKTRVAIMGRIPSALSLNRKYYNCTCAGLKPLRLGFTAGSIPITTEYVAWLASFL